MPGWSIPRRARSKCCTEAPSNRLEATPLEGAGRRYWKLTVAVRITGTAWPFSSVGS